MKHNKKFVYKVGQRVHLKMSNVNGVITSLIYEREVENPYRKFPYIFIKWDTEVPDELRKNYYDPFDIVPEIKIQNHKKPNKIRKLENVNI
jgi:hypothetical protein